MTVMTVWMQGVGEGVVVVVGGEGGRANFGDKFSKTC